MHLVTRLLWRLFAVGGMMLVVALLVTFSAARQDIGRETASSQKVGSVARVLGELRSAAPLQEQVQEIDQLNRSGVLRHLHVALFDVEGKRLTQPPLAPDPGPLPWLGRLLKRNVEVPATALPVARSDGTLVTVVLEPSPDADAAEAVYNMLIFLGLYTALAAALVAAMWVSVRLAFSPLSAILAALARFEGGDFGARIARCATRELDYIAQALNHLAAALDEQRAKQRELLHRLQDVQEDERRRLAHELHDEFGQLLTTIQVDASYLKHQTAGQPELQSCAQAMVDNSSSILSQLRDLLAQLRPYGLQGGEEREIALEQALRDLVRQRQARGDAQLACHLAVELGAAQVPQRLAVAIYRIVQEALTNVLRHAQASRVGIVLAYDPTSDEIRLTVSDDGIGLGAPAQESQGKGLGMAGIRERVLANQGRVQFKPAQPSGLVLEAAFPLGDGHD